MGTRILGSNARLLRADESNGAGLAFGVRVKRSIKMGTRRKMLFATLDAELILPLLNPLQCL